MALDELPLSAQHPVRKTGLPVLGEMSWGSHCCHFFQTQRDLLETLLPYFKVGLEARELCVWIVHAPMTEAAARRALRQAVPSVDRYLTDGSIEIVSSGEWYLNGGRFSLKRVMQCVGCQARAGRGPGLLGDESQWQYRVARKERLDALRRIRGPAQ